MCTLKSMIVHKHNIFCLLDESSFYKCPDRLRLPLIFYFGHTAAVYVNKLMLAGLLKVGFFHNNVIFYKLL